MKHHYATKQNALAITKIQAGKKHRVRKLLNSKNLVAGIITIVGSMLMGAQADAVAPPPADVEWIGDDSPGSDMSWENPDANSFSDGSVLKIYSNTNSVNFLGKGVGTVTIIGALAPKSVMVVSGEYTFDGAGTITVTDGFGIGGNLTIASTSVIPQGDITVNGGTLELATNSYNGFDVGSSITIQAGGTMRADNTTQNAFNIGALTLNGGILTSVNGPGGPANDDDYGNWIFNGDVTVVGSASSSISASTVSTWDGTQKFIVGDVTGNPATDLLVSSVIRDAATRPQTKLIKEGPGTMTLTGANTYTGTTNVNAGTLALNGAANSNTTIVGDGNITTDDVVINGGTLRNDASEQIADDASILLTAGTYDLNGAIETIKDFKNTGGTFTTGAGTLTGSGTAANTIIWTGGSNTINDGGTVQDTHWDVSGGANTVEGGTTGGTLHVQSGETGFEFTGTGAPSIVLNSDGTNAGRMLLEGDMIVAAGYNGTGATITSGGSAANAGYIDLGGAVRNFIINDSAAAASDLSISASITNGGLTKAGPGTMTLSGANTYTGVTTINAGRLVAGSTSAFGTNSAVTVASFAFLELDGNNNSIGSLAGAGTVENASATAATLTTGGVNTSTTFSGLLQDGAGGGALSLTKNGGGTLVLSNDDNTYTGETIVEAGILELDNDTTTNNIAASSVIWVQGPGELDVNGLNNGTLILSGGQWLHGSGVVDGNVRVIDGSRISPGGLDRGRQETGLLEITGNLNIRGRFLAQISDVNGNDTVRVGGRVRLNDGTSVLDLGALDAFVPADIQCGERFNLIDIGGTLYDDETIAGSWSRIRGFDGDTQLLFDLGTGDLVGTGLAPGEDLEDIPSINANQLAVFEAVADAAIDEIDFNAGNYNSDDDGMGEVLDRILRAADAGGIGGKLAALNSLLPESYAGAADYALHATRNYTDTVMRTTPMAAAGSVAPPVYHDPKGGMQPDEKGGPVTPVAASDGHNYQLFGGYTSMDINSDSSNNGNDYDLESNGGYAGLRGKLGDQLTYGGFIAIDNGSVESTGLDLDVDGYVAGAFVHYEACDKVGLWGSVSYGDFSYDGTRTAVGTRLTVDDFDADALQLGLGADYLAYSNNGLSITSGIGLRYIDASTDDITETGGAAALNIEGIDAESLLAEFVIKLAYSPDNANYGVNAYVGYQHDFEDGDRDVDAAFAAGGATFRTLAPGLGDEAVIYGAGGYYDITDDLRVSAGYHGESRSDADELNSFDLRFTYGF